MSFVRGLGQNIDIKKIISNARQASVRPSHFFNNLYSFSIGPGRKYPGLSPPEQPVGLASDEQIEPARMTETENYWSALWPLSSCRAQVCMQIVPMLSQ